MTDFLRDFYDRKRFLFDFLQEKKRRKLKNPVSIRVNQRIFKNFAES